MSKITIVIIPRVGREVFFIGNPSSGSIDKRGCFDYVKRLDAKLKMDQLFLQFVNC